MKTRIVSSESAQGCLRVVLDGDNPGDETRALLLTIRGLAEQAGQTRILLNALALPSPSRAERYHVGEVMAEIFPGGYRIALAFPPQLINGFSENVAVNRGASMRVTGDEASAFAWLNAQDN